MLVDFLSNVVVWSLFTLSMVTLFAKVTTLAIYKGKHKENLEVRMGWYDRMRIECTFNQTKKKAMKIANLLTSVFWLFVFLLGLLLLVIKTQLS